MRDPATQLEYVERATVVHHRSNTLDSIDRALERIDEQRYGWCTSCGELIETGRLEALPFTQFCISCKSGTTRGEGHQHRGRAA
ncbi:MAG: hypothetical protein FJ215_05630 [Ignavibacteria bacterium]|nr:hypothetical protein [Ignavibacteria bacterium]